MGPKYIKTYSVVKQVLRGKFITTPTVRNKKELTETTLMSASRRGKEEQTKPKFNIRK